MNISIGCDHGGYAFKQQIITYLQELGHQVMDVGTYSQDSCDYPEFGIKASEQVRDQKVDFGIVICRSGVGLSMVANKVKGVRAALCLTPNMARLARQHNNANVLSMGADLISVDEAKEIIKTFLTTAFEGGRHQRRVDLITEYESR